jgi:hypothetical protein
MQMIPDEIRAASIGDEPVTNRGRFLYYMKKKYENNTGSERELIKEMGVRFARAYFDILDDLGEALAGTEGCWELLGLTMAEWNGLGEEERLGCIRMLADDVFYGLGGAANLPFESGWIKYDRKRHIIAVHSGSGVVHIVYLI